MRILLVEDEESIRRLIKMNLELESYEVVPAVDGREALDKFSDQHFDLIILDVMLPEINGFDVCEQIRLSNFQVPILMLTAKDTSHDRIKGLKTGADDYLTKPFVLEELLLRVRSLLRRSAPVENHEFNSYTFGNNSIDFITYTAVSKSKGEFQLTKKEVKLLKLLIDRKNEVVSRQQILQSVWGYDVFPSTRTIDNFILNFRKYFEDDSKAPVFFHSVRGIGYKFTDQQK